jgi:glycosyltransferase involved in cell wall biosynthesis
MNRRRRILLTYIHDSPFIKTDLHLLEKHYDLRTISFGAFRNDKRNLPRSIWELMTGIIWCDATFTWFADYHAFIVVQLSRLLNKKSIVMVGGHEVAKLPEISYGRLVLNPGMGALIRYVLKKADRLLLVGDSLREEAKVNLGIEREHSYVVPTGHDQSKFEPLGDRSNRILTVGYLDQMPRRKKGGFDPFKRKGLDLFIETARIMPDIEFLLIGDVSEKLVRDRFGQSPSNLKFVGPVPHDRLVKYYQESKVYCQFSIHEGLPTALCEAMLCGCIPVGTKITGIATAIGDTGFIVDERTPEKAAEAIRKALMSGSGEKARQRIIGNFSLEIRERNLVRIIDELIGAGK